MATKTLKGYPTSTRYNTSSGGFSLYAPLFDGNLDVATTIGSASNITVIFDGFDFSSLPSNATVTDISVYFKGKASASYNKFQIRLIKDHTSGSSYTDLGDGSVTLTNGTSLCDGLTSFPSATSACTADFLKGNKLQMRIYYTKSVVYELYVQVTYDVPTFTITANASPTAGGTVTGGGTYESGKTATLTATPATGYKFKQWSDGNTSATRTVTVTGNATYTAQFELLTYSILTAASPTEGGSVTGGGVHSYGSTVTLTAIPNNGYEFVRWTDGVTTASRNVTVTAAASYTAVFEQVATSNIFKGTQRQTVYRGTKKQSVYIGTTKIT